jgi:CRP/FNR family transcriptional regulator
MDDDRIGRALAASHFGRLSAPTRRRLLAGSRLVTRDAGSVVHAEGDQQPHLDVVVSGFARVFVAAPDGRSLTVRYCRPGSILGAFSLFVDGFAMPATVQSLLATGYLVLDARRVRELASTDGTVADALLRELSERVHDFVSEIARGSFTTVRQRVARHLLDLASQDQQDDALVAKVSQEHLAESVGTAREVVVRVLRQLRTAGLVSTAREAITIRDAVGLFAESETSGLWNPGS